jgi:hypothetical protein
MNSLLCSSGGTGFQMGHSMSAMLKRKMDAVVTFRGVILSVAARGFVASSGVEGSDVR